MKAVYVVSDSIISPLGFGTSENYSKLLLGQTAIKLHENTALSPSPFCAALIDNYKLDEAFDGDSNAYTQFEKLCILAVREALKNTSIQIESERTLLVLSTTKGNVDLLLRNPFQKDRIYLHQTSTIIQHYFKNPNTPLVISNACISGLVALNVAADMLQEDKYDTIIVCGADIVCEFTISGFDSFKALSAQPCKPFDAYRAGTSLGEGAGAIILSAKNKSKLQILSGASSNDANHISGPSRTGDGLFIAVEKTLKSYRYPSIDFISAHGTGTVFNDEMEAKAFNLAGLEAVPINSLKGYFGHTFGAAGIIESAITLESMRKNHLISSLGYENKSEAISINIIEENHEKELTTCLKTASGFGGCNAALLFQKGK